jgi:hypothetical protein
MPLPTGTLIYQTGFKHTVYDTLRMPLLTPVVIECDYYNRFFAIERGPGGGVVTAFPGCGWDGATWFPDFKWVMLPSLKHDILHWGIAEGVIPTSQNAAIDREIEASIRHEAPSPWTANAAVWGRIVRRGTNLAAQERGPSRPIYVVGPAIPGGRIRFNSEQEMNEWLSGKGWL